MKDFEGVYETNTEWPDYLRCNHCGERVERGIANVSTHWLHCLKRIDGIIVTNNDWEKSILDSWSINV